MRVLFCAKQNCIVEFVYMTGPAAVVFCGSEPFLTLKFSRITFQEAVFMCDCTEADFVLLILTCSQLFHKIVEKFTCLYMYYTSVSPSFTLQILEVGIY